MSAGGRAKKFVREFGRGITHVLLRLDTKIEVRRRPLGRGYDCWMWVGKKNWDARSRTERLVTEEEIRSAFGMVRPNVRLAARVALAAIHGIYHLPGEKKHGLAPERVRLFERPIGSFRKSH